MPRMVALLRAINVGGRTVTMARLREAFLPLGLTGVDTFIASGNVIFETRARSTPALERRIADALERDLGFPVTTFLRLPEELRDITREVVPGGEDPALSRYVAFLKRPLGPPEVAALRDLGGPVDRFEVRGREVHWLCRKTIGQSEVTTARLERALGQPTTIRSLSSLRKLVAKVSAPG